MPHAEHVESQNGEARSAVEMTPCCPPPIPLHGSASEANSSSADAQVVLCHRYLVVFHPFIEQLTVFHTSGLVLASSSILRVLDLDLPLRWHREQHMPNRYVNPKPVYFNRKPVTDRHTYKHNLRLRPH